jgi:hypothetical protein
MLSFICNKQQKYEKNKNKGDVLDRNQTIHKGKTKEGGRSGQKHTINTQVQHSKERVLIETNNK